MYVVVVLAELIEAAPLTASVVVPVFVVLVPRRSLPPVMLSAPTVELGLATSVAPLLIVTECSVAPVD